MSMAYVENVADFIVACLDFAQGSCIQLRR